MEHIWNLKFQNDHNFEQVYTSKIINIKDNKLAETNYKIIQGILPCGVNLVRWKRKNTANCDVCNQNETVEHLLYECKYASNIWSKVMRAFNIQISLSDVILGNDLSPEMNFISSIVVYLIYKEWVTLSIDTKKRSENPNMIRYIKELSYYNKICKESISLQKYVRNIEKLVEYLKDSLM